MSKTKGCKTPCLASGSGILLEYHAQLAADLLEDTGNANRLGVRHVTALNTAGLNAVVDAVRLVA